MTEKDYKEKIGKLVDNFLETQRLERDAMASRDSNKHKARCDAITVESRELVIDVAVSVLSDFSKLADALQVLALHRNGSLLSRTPSTKQD